MRLRIVGPTESVSHQAAIRDRCFGDFILVSELEDPPLIAETPQLQELQQACSLETEDLWDRLIPDQELQSMILQIIDNF